ncbi:MAG: hypothetical protein HRT99_01270 [Mycoplasmatales bacterium]|nr:hypothetical protein [Mycoplasmatales bacterium]
MINNKKANSDLNNEIEVTQEWKNKKNKKNLSLLSLFASLGAIALAAGAVTGTAVVIKISKNN